jgi:alpha-D-ribose 1-methylphosphonate 5-triphosphate synthase subunit PhnH
VTSSTSLSAVSPPGSVGTVDITVTSPTGTSPATAADHFTYKA